MEDMIKEYLEKNLSIEISKDYDNLSDYEYIEVRLVLNNKTISEDRIEI